MSDPQAELPSVHVYYKLAHPKNEPLKINIDDLPGKLTDSDKKLAAVSGYLSTYGQTHKMTADTSLGRVCPWQKPNAFAPQIRSSQTPDIGKNSGGAASNPYALYVNF